MMNVLGKTLVLMNTLVAMVLFFFALAIFTNAIDWGWKEPRKAWLDPPEGKRDPANERIASELDRRMVALEQANDHRYRAMARVQQAQAALNTVEGKFAENRTAYMKEMSHLRGTKGDAAAKIEVKEVKVDEKGVVLEPQTQFGRPSVSVPVEGVEKTYWGYEKELEALRKEILDTALECRELGDKAAKLTILLNGQRDKGDKGGAPGYYEMIGIETESQRRIQEEIEAVQPLWVRELVNAQLLKQRKENLVRRLRELGEKAE